MAYNSILVDQVDGGVGIITFNRPQVLNALNFELTSELDDAATMFERDPDIRAVVITGLGDRAFSAGYDIHESAATPPEVAAQRAEPRSMFTWHLANLQKPTIGAINGLCYGGAAVLATSLDIRIGCERSSFRFVAAARGRINSTWCLPVVVGLAKAKELLYTARSVEAEEAERIGLLNRVVPSDQLMAEAIEMGRMIGKNNPDMVRGIKELLHQHIGHQWRTRYDEERTAIATAFRPAPIAEGFADFFQRKGSKQS